LRAKSRRNGHFYIDFTSNILKSRQEKHMKRTIFHHYLSKHEEGKKKVNEMNYHYDDK